MRYKLDASGYISAVSFGCYLDNCTEYTGAIPTGYASLDAWASYACIQAYYIDQKGNLTLDSYRKAEIERLQEQDAINNSPVLRKDIFDVEEVLNEQYVRKTKTGNVIVLEDIKPFSPKVKITGVNPYKYSNLSIYTQGKNMMPCDAVSCIVAGVAFTKNMSGSISVLGTATENVEYIIADGEETTLFALKANTDYYLNLGGLQCELRYFDGETTAQQYIGASGSLNLPEHIEVTQVVIKIASGDTVNTTFYPQLEFGTEFTSYDAHKCKIFELDISGIDSEPLLPSDTLYPEDTLYPGYVINTVDYINIENGKVVISVNDKERVLCSGNISLFGDYSTLYSVKDVTIEIEYSDNMLDVESLAFLQGKSTTTNQFKILKDGSIEAHNGFFGGKIEADSGYFKGKIEADSGYFKGDVTGGTIRIGTLFSVDDRGNVVANSLKSNNAEITGGSINIKTASSGENAIELNYSSFSNSLSPSEIRLYSTYGTSYLTGSGLTTNNIKAYGSEISVNSNIKFLGSATLGIGYTHKVEGALECSGSVTCKGTGTFSAENNIVKLGRSGSMVGFFGDSGASKKSVSEIYSTSSATASSVATKLNELIKALKAYNLIG